MGINLESGLKESESDVDQGQISSRPSFQQSLRGLPAGFFLVVTGTFLIVLVFTAGADETVDALVWISAVGAGMASGETKGAVIGTTTKGTAKGAETPISASGLVAWVSTGAVALGTVVCIGEWTGAAGFSAAGVGLDVETGEATCAGSGTGVGVVAGAAIGIGAGAGNAGCAGNWVGEAEG